ncbi:hypothetical protein [Intrasporangium sp.]|jgi:hypothetical protein|uniref:hypothetical protein n=1 Tax=Intrasporangium sp. TaxID=1925024 RepID=UPI0033658EDD
MKHIRIAAIAAATMIGLTAAPAHAALPPVSTFVVVTSFAGGSPIIEADGVWTGCTEVRDISNVGNQVSPSRVVFSGVKEVVCPDGNVLIQYAAELNFRSAENSFGKTSGTWQLIDSDNPGINEGAGTVRGTSRNCDGCIVDTFSGRVV